MTIKRSWANSPDAAGISSTSPVWICWDTPGAKLRIWPPRIMAVPLLEPSSATNQVPCSKRTLACWRDIAKFDAMLGNALRPSTVMPVRRSCSPIAGSASVSTGTAGVAAAFAMGCGAGVGCGAATGAGCGTGMGVGCGIDMAPGCGAGAGIGCGVDIGCGTGAG